MINSQKGSSLLWIEIFLVYENKFEIANHSKKLLGRYCHQIPGLYWIQEFDPKGAVTFRGSPHPNSTNMLLNFDRQSDRVTMWPEPVLIPPNKPLSLTLPSTKTGLIASPSRYLV